MNLASAIPVHYDETEVDRDVATLREIGRP